MKIASHWIQAVLLTWLIIGAEKKDIVSRGNMKDSLTENFFDLKELIFKPEIDEYYDFTGKVVDKEGS